MVINLQYFYVQQYFDAGWITKELLKTMLLMLGIEFLLNINI